MSTYFYYLRTPKTEALDREGSVIKTGNAPVVTICLLVKEKVIARGVSIMSESDNPNKKDGRKFALAYARKAMGMKKNGNPILLAGKGYVSLMSREGLNMSYAEKVTEGLLFKSLYRPTLTGRERDILYRGDR